MSVVPLVSVICLCYNHEKYIKKSLDSILMQKVNFDFEVIIHDDASTDNSVEIIKDYHQKYPDKIVPILQSENQYSKSINITTTYIYPKVRGKYIALCECDDYWIDEFKLQKQIEFLEAHDEYSACIHAAYKIDAKTKKIIKKIILANKDIDFTVNEALEGLGSEAATNSFFYRSKYIGEFKEFKKKIPDTGVGDYLLLIFLGIVGRIHYLNQIMSVYRANVDNSWTSRMSFSLKEHLKYLDKHINMLQQLFVILPEDSHNKLNMVIRSAQFNRLLVEGKFFKAKSKYPDLYNKISDLRKIKILIRYICLRIDDSGKLFHIIVNMYRKLWRANEWAI